MAVQEKTRLKQEQVREQSEFLAARVTPGIEPAFNMLQLTTANLQATGQIDMGRKT
jgi:hypothetical protein